MWLCGSAGTSQIIDNCGTCGASTSRASPVSAPDWIHSHNNSEIPPGAVVYRTTTEMFHYLFLASLISLFMVGSSVLPGVSPTEDAMTTVWGSELEADAVRIWYVCSSPPAPGKNTTSCMCLHIVSISLVVVDHKH